MEFLRGIGNPLGVKVSQKMDPAELVSMIAKLNPQNVPGRLAIICRMGADNLRVGLPKLIDAVQNSGQVSIKERSHLLSMLAEKGFARPLALDATCLHAPTGLTVVALCVQIVTWICDPVHGNTETCNGIKTRRFDKIQEEIEAFFDVHDQMGTVPGGLHVEMTGDDVTECIGGGSSVSAADLNSRYHTHCDPRLNAEQALEISFYVASRLRDRKNKLKSKNCSDIPAVE